MLSGEMRIDEPGKDTVSCAADSYCYLPPVEWSVSAAAETKLLIFSKDYIAHG